MGGDSKAIIGRVIRQLRETAGLSQERLAERAGITYQYLSSVENGKENFTIGVLDALAKALDMDIPIIVERAYTNHNEAPAVKPSFFISGPLLPPMLMVSQIETALNETHYMVHLLNTTLRRVSGRPLSAFIQGNNFGGIVSNILCDSLSRFSSYKHNHDQRYPDLVYKTENGKCLAGLEVKTTIRPGKGGESHNGHSGWHLIACYSLNRSNGDICFVHIMCAELNGHDQADADWKYLGSKVNEATGSQRTETYITNAAGTAKLRHGTVYLDTDSIDISRWRTSKSISAPACSPFK